MKRSVFGWGLVTALVAATGACTVAGFLGRWGWVLELTCHFRLQYLLILTFATGFFLLGRKRKRALIAGLLAAANLLLIVPAYFRPSPGEHLREAANAGNKPCSLRALLLNVEQSNRSYRKVIDLIANVDPDVAVLLETDTPWAGALQAGLVDYPYVLSEPLDNKFGLTLLSRLPIVDQEVMFLAGRDLPSLRAEVLFDDRRFTLIAAHAVPPKSGRHARLRNEQLTALAELVGDQQHPVMILGDLNVTPWSPFFCDLLEETGLLDSRRGFGLQPSWPASFAPLRIPIDHCLGTPDIRIHDRWIGSSIGSDHFPVVVEFSLARP
jgi:endonuclease/exonuclease/phosphatase (EEP) superfamily protein YafD